MKMLGMIDYKIVIASLISLVGIVAVITLGIIETNAHELMLQGKIPQELLTFLSMSPSQSGLYLLSAILSVTLLKWPIFKEITSLSWKGALRPLAITNAISLVGLAGLFLPIFVFCVLFAVILSKMYETFVLIFCNAALAFIIFPPLFAFIEMIVLFICYEKVFQWNFRNFIYLCAGQTLYLGFLTLFAIYVLPIL